jgi:hypothetical protein
VQAVYHAPCPSAGVLAPDLLGDQSPSSKRMQQQTCQLGPGKLSGGSISSTHTQNHDREHAHAPEHVPGSQLTSRSDSFSFGVNDGSASAALPAWFAAAPGPAEHCAPLPPQGSAPARAAGGEGHAAHTLQLQHQQQQPHIVRPETVPMDVLDAEPVPGFPDFSHCMDTLDALHYKLATKGFRGIGIFVPSLFPDVQQEVRGLLCHCCMHVLIAVGQAAFWHSGIARCRTRRKTWSMMAGQHVLKRCQHTMCVHTSAVPNDLTEPCAGLCHSVLRLWTGQVTKVPQCMQDPAAQASLHHPPAKWTCWLGPQPAWSLTAWRGRQSWLSHSTWLLEQQWCQSGF